MLYGPTLVGAVLPDPYSYDSGSNRCLKSWTIASHDLVTGDILTVWSDGSETIGCTGPGTAMATALFHLRLSQERALRQSKLLGSLGPAVPRYAYIATDDVYVVVLDMPQHHEVTVEHPRYGVTCVPVDVLTETTEFETADLPPLTHTPRLSAEPTLNPYTDASYLRAVATEAFAALNRGAREPSEAIAYAFSVTEAPTDISQYQMRRTAPETRVVAATLAAIRAVQDADLVSVAFVAQLVTLVNAQSDPITL